MSIQNLGAKNYIILTLNISFCLKYMIIVFWRNLYAVFFKKQRQNDITNDKNITYFLTKNYDKVEICMQSI